MFHYSGSWHCWSRVLSEDHPKGPFIEVNLTPLPCCSSSTWANDVAPIRIRAHCTRREYSEHWLGDLWICDMKFEQLPESVHRAMVSNLGAELTKRLLTEDFLPQIDWDLYRQKCNGGANLEDIRLR